MRPSPSAWISAISTFAWPYVTFPGRPWSTIGRRPNVDHKPVSSLDLGAELVEKALDSAGISRDRLLGVGMGLAVPIDSSTGELQADGILPGWRGIWPAAEMSERLGVDVQVENDANAGALGEKVFGAGRGTDDMIYLRLSDGVGGALILGGRLYGGGSGFAGEIGHVLAQRDGVICRCGNRGCLETVAGSTAVAALLGRSLNREISTQQLLELVRTGDRGACRAVADAGRAVGTVTAAMVNVLNPTLVVVGGDLAATGDVLLNPLRESVVRYTVGPAFSAVRIIPGTLGDRAEVLGAAALVLAESHHALVRRVAQA